jgi:hypothetical protein
MKTDGATRTKKKVIGAAPHILRQNILDTRKSVSYTAINKKSSNSISHSR